MKGIFFSPIKSEEYKAAWDKAGVKPLEVVTAFANSVALFPSDEGIVIGKLFATGVAEDNSKVFASDQSDLIRELAEPKPKTLTQADHERRYRGYDWLLAEGVIADPRSKAAHKAWTTTRLWQSEVLRGNFSHDVRVQYQIAGQAFIHTDRAVCMEHARSVARKAVRKLAKDLGVKKLIHEIEISPILPSEQSGATGNA